MKTTPPPPPRAAIFQIVVCPPPALRILGEPARRFHILARTEAEAHRKAIESYARAVPKYLQEFAAGALGIEPAGAGAVPGPAAAQDPTGPPEAPPVARYAVLECGDNATRRVIPQAEVKDRDGCSCDVIGEWLTLEEATARASKSRV